MVQNVVLNNSDHNFSAWADGLRASQDTTKVVPTAGTVAAITSDLRGQLAAGALVSSGQGISADHHA